MSHFVGLVIGFLSSLDRYDEDLKVEPYIIHEATEAYEVASTTALNILDNFESFSDVINKDELINLVNSKKRLELIEWYTTWGNYHHCDKNGNIYSTYNPESKWDWYVVGGRWDGYIPTKSDKYVNQCTVQEVDWEKIKVPFCFIDINGEWQEKGEMGWWCVVNNEKEDWDKIFKDFSEYVQEHYPDELITVIDFHI